MFIAALFKKDLNVHERMNGYRKCGVYICAHKIEDFETIWTYVNSLGDHNLGGWGKEWVKTEKGRDNPEMWLPRHWRSSANLTSLLTASLGWREILQGLEEREPGLSITRAEFWSHSCLSGLQFLVPKDEGMCLSVFSKLQFIQVVFLWVLSEL